MICTICMFCILCLQLGRLSPSTACTADTADPHSFIKKRGKDSKAEKGQEMEPGKSGAFEIGW